MSACLTPDTPPPTAAATMPCALSQTQRDILLRQELLGSAIYTIGVSVSIDGAIDPRLLDQATRDVIAAEPMLRARLHTAGDTPQWQIQPEVHWQLPFTDAFAACGDAAQAAQRAADDIAALQSRGIDVHGATLWHMALWRTAADQYVWLLGFNHLLVDGYAVMRVGQRILQRYGALSRGEHAPASPGPSYARFVAREQAYLQSPRYARDALFWQQRLAGSDGGGAPAAATLAPPAPLHHRWTAPAAHWQALQRHAAAHGVSAAQALLGLLAVYCAKISGQAEVVVGMPVHNRKDAVDKLTVGMFANTLPLRLRVAAQTSWTALLQALAEDTRQVLRHQQYPLDRALVQAPPRQGVAGMHFDLLVSFEPFDPQATLGQARLRFAPFSGHPGFAAIAAYVRDYGDSADLPVDLVLDPRAGAALRHTLFLSERLDQLLRLLPSHADAALDDIDLLGPRERAALLALQPLPQPRPPHTLHALVSAQAHRTPQACAVRCGAQWLSYAALDQAANQLAHTLRTLGVRRGVYVPVWMERRLPLVVALLGVLKAGGAYVPLDADLPPARLRDILQQTAARVVLTQPELQAQAHAAAPHPLHVLDAPLDAPEGCATPPSETTADDVALVIFTSGSTGQPKGVMLTHRAVVNHKLWNLRAVDFGANDRLLQKSSLSFDASVSEFFLPLLCGAAVHLAPPGLQRDLPALLQTVIRDGITHLTLAPSTARALVDDPALPACTSLRVIQFGGEPLDAALAARFHAVLPQARLMNFYGPSEATEDSSASVIDCAHLPDSAVLPVGRPVDNLRIDVRDDRLRLLPFDVVGEVCIAGTGLARGYLGAPELTAGRFVQPAGQPGQRLLRSGDLGYWSAQGLLYIAGRNDDQIKLRGFRIEPGEIERHLLRHPAVAQAVVVPWLPAVRPGGGEQELAAYVVLHADAADTPLQTLRQMLQASLPHYMVPSAWLALPALPLTASGKIDRRALPAPQRLSDAAITPRREPDTPTERLLWAIWSEVLHTTDFGSDDHFFDLGGHSLTLTQVRSRLQARLGRSVPLADLFHHLRLRDLAQHLDRLQAAATTDLPIPPQPRDAALPVSLSQRRMWLIQQFHPQTVAYNVTAPLRLRGPLDAARLEQALTLLIARHEALRTQFALQDGEPVQVILPTLPSPLQRVDLRALDPAAREAAARHTATALTAQPFDLRTAPLYRVCLMQLAADDHVLLWVLHHTIADNWALAVLSRDALELYAGLLHGDAGQAAARLPPLPLHYADYAAWQRSAAASAAREPHLSYWTQRLHDLGELPLPVDFPRTAAPSGRGHTLVAPLPAALQQALRDAATTHGLTPFMLLLAAFDVLLARLCRSSDIAVGTPIANRQHAATEPLVGTLVNTLVMRNHVALEQTFRQFAMQVRDTALQAYAHQDAPFDEVVERLQARRTDVPPGLVRVLFNVLNAPLGVRAAVPFSYAAFDFERVAAQFDLSLHIDTEFSQRLHLEYATDLFRAETARHLLDSYVQLCSSLLAQPDLPLYAHPLCTPTQRALLARWNATQDAAAPLHRPLPQLLSTGAADRGERLAVSDSRGHALTYAALHARALGIAELLRQHGIGRGDRVGLCLQRHTDLPAALLGVLHAGAAYVPLDPAFPPLRLLDMAGDARLRAILTETALLPLLAAAGVPQFALDGAELADRQRTTPLPADPQRDPRADDPAYLIYTSGSTGRPKGVLVPHRAVANLLHGMARAPGLAAGDVLLAVTTLSFDIAVAELLLPLYVGARVVLADAAQARDPAALRALLQGSGATVLQATPSTWRALLDSGWSGSPGLRAWIGGEALPADLAPRLLAACAAVWNLYGPTETTVWSSCWQVQPQQPIAIGRPIANTQIHVLDPHGQPCPIGFPGEIHIGGAGVALGYFDRPQLSAERFVADGFGAGAGTRLYKTGDLGRWRSDGQLEHLGRLDHQLKLRGYRIEPAEIDAALRAQPGVGDCALGTQTLDAGDTRLVAYVVPAAGAPAPDAATLRQALRQRLPHYMVPQHIVPLAALPRLPNGKLDRAALPAPASAEAPAPSAALLPQTAAEQRIAAIWSELLGVPQVLRTDNFFDLGGHSLLAMRAVLAIEQQLGWRIAPQRLIVESLGQIARADTAGAAQAA